MSDDDCCKKSFFESAKDTAARLLKDPRRCPTWVQDQRMGICTECEHFTKAGKCDLCGCYMNLKVQHRNLTCPINKWTEWTDEN